MEACTGAERSMLSMKGFVETGRAFVIGLGRAGLGGPLRFLKGLLERRGEGPQSGRRSKGVSQCTIANLSQSDNKSAREWCTGKTGFPQLVKLNKAVHITMTNIMKLQGC